MAALGLYVVPPQRHRLEFQLQTFDYGILYHATGGDGRRAGRFRPAAPSRAPGGETPEVGELAA